MILVHLPSLRCPFRNLRAIPKAIILHSVGYCILVLFFFLYFSSKLFLILKKFKGYDNMSFLCWVYSNFWVKYYILRENVCTFTHHFLQCCRLAALQPRDNAAKKCSFSQRIVFAFTYISLLMYAASSKLCLSLLLCVKLGESKFLFLDGNIKCYQIFQYLLFAYLHGCFHFAFLPRSCPRLLSTECGRIGVK